jgi:HEAT repeat protein
MVTNYYLFHYLKPASMFNLRLGMKVKRLKSRCLALSIGLWLACAADPFVTTALAEGSGGSQTLSAARFPAAIERLRHANPDIRAAAAAELGQAPPPLRTKAAAALQKALKDNSSAVRLAAIKALGKLKSAAAPAVPDLIMLLTEQRSPGGLSGNMSLSSNSLDLTEALIDTLSDIGPPARQSVPFLVPFLSDRGAFYRRDKILEALSEIGPDASATQALIEVIHQEGHRTKTRQTAINLLGRIDPPTKETMTLLTDIASDATAAEDKAEASKAIKVLAQKPLAQPSVSADIAKLSEDLAPDKDEETRLNALSKIEESGANGRYFIPAVVKLLGDRSQAVKLAAMDALAGIGPDAYPAIPLLVDNNIAERSDEKRLHAFLAIAKIDPQGMRTIPLLQQALQDPFEVRYAIELLNRFGTEQSTSLAQEAKRRWRIR